MAFEVKSNAAKNLPKILEAYLNSIEQEITLICFETERTAKQNLTDLGKIDRGFTRNSIDNEVIRTGFEVEGIVFAGTTQAPWIEFGRHGSKQSYIGTGKNSASAAFPPIEPIREWVKRNRKKLGISGSKKAQKRDKAGKFVKGAIEKEIDRTAFLIARKIHEKGIEPTPYLVPAFMSIVPFYQARIVKAISNTQFKAGPTP